MGNTGNVQSRSDYTAFGEPIGADTGLLTAAQGYGKSGGLRQGYALTEKDDATGLDHTWFRKNENKAGRWTSPDPYNGSMSLGNPQSFNRYSYVENEPTNFVDPSGLFMCSAEYSYSQCGGNAGFWGRGSGFGDHVAWFELQFGGVPSSSWEFHGQYLLNLEVNRFLTWLGGKRAIYIGNWTWDSPYRGSATFNPNRGWDNYFDINSGRFNFPTFRPRLDIRSSGRLPADIEGRMVREIQAAVPPVRSPDYVTVNGSALTTGTHLTLDGCGNLYTTPFSIVPRFPFGSDRSIFSFMRLGGNVSAGWLNQVNPPTAQQSEQFLTGLSTTFSAGSPRVFGGSFVYAPGVGTATELGAYSPGIGVSGAASWRFGRVNQFAWRNCN